MQRELRAYEKKQGMDNLVKAAEYLHSAIDIFEEAGLNSKADKVLKILAKIALQSKGANIPDVEFGIMPSPEDWLKHGVTNKDIKEFRVNFISKAKINKALRMMGYPEDKILRLLGSKNIMSVKEVEELLNPHATLNKIYDWMHDPNQSIDQPGSQIKPDHEIEFSSVADSTPFDRHTKGLTPDRMVKNIEEHGHPMNLADDGFADDLLNADIDDNVLEVTEGEDPSKTFEDSD